MTFNQAIRTCFRKYVTFSGRASRPEYWYFVLFIVIWSVLAAIIDWQFFSTVTRIEAEGASATLATSPQPVGSIVALIVFLPHLAVAWRRMHDTGRSGFFVLLPLILMASAFAVLIFGIGTAGLFAHGGGLDLFFTRATALILIPTLIVLTISPLLVLWWLARPGQPGPNAYGPNPSEVSQ
ncbi:MAG TPA: DUF805 domain-containing protein [Rhodobacteraceae bacterium]|nr:DUF805 domain-containing protein [Paracoccaceae bacterium]